MEVETEVTFPSVPNKSPERFANFKFEASKFCAKRFVVVAKLEKKFVDEAEVADKVFIERLLAKIPPALFIEKIEALLESKISKIFATCPRDAKSVIAVEALEVDCTVTTEFETDVVVPKDDCPAPLTALADPEVTAYVEVPDVSAYAGDVICWRGPSVSKLKLFAETSTCKYTLLLLLKL